MSLSFDEVLSTTKAVRQRLDLEREVPREVLLECAALANYAPSSRNTQPWRFLFVDDPGIRGRVAALYASVWDALAGPMYAREIDDAFDDDSRAAIRRMRASSKHLRDHLAEVPVLLFPLLEGRAEEFGNAVTQSLKWGSAVPAAWSFMLAARSRGLGTSWTSLHLVEEQAMAEIIGIDHTRYTQIALIPIAYTLGTDFRPPPRRDVAEAVLFNGMSQGSV